MAKIEIVTNDQITDDEIEKHRYVYFQPISQVCIIRKFAAVRQYNNVSKASALRLEWLYYNRGLTVVKPFSFYAMRWE